MTNMLITLIVFCVIAGLLYYLVSLLPLPAPFPTIIRICVILICIFMLWQVLGGSVPSLSLRR